MKTNTFYLSLLLFFSIIGTGFTQETFSFTGCVTNQEGAELIYATIQIDGEKNIQTDLDGCYHFESKQASVSIKISYPGYLSKEKKLDATESPKIILNYWAGTHTLGLTETKTAPTLERALDTEYILNGIVTSTDKKALIGVSVQLGDTPYGTVTDFDGHFKLASSKKCTNVSFSYVGYETLNMEICADKSSKVVLKENSVALDEVVVLSEGATDKKRSRRISKHSKSVPMTMSISDEAMLSPPPSSSVSESYGYSTAAYEEIAVSEPTKMTKEERFMRKLPPEGDIYLDKDTEKEEELPDAGQLTAGEINDFSKWDMWADISQEDLAMHRGDWKQYADHRYTIQLTTPTGLAVVNAKVELNDGQGNVLWRARTNNSGQAEMWAHYFLETKRPANGLSITGSYKGKSFDIPNAKVFKEGINFYTLEAECDDSPVIDIAFVVDATGSMSDEIQYLQAELLNVIARVQDSLPAADIQSASVFYKDKSDDYLTKISPFTADIAATVKFIQAQGAGGGGDFPEAVDNAMEDAIEKLDWREEATTRILFLVLDAPPHQEEENLQRMNVAVTKAASMGIQIIPVACSGINKSTEYLMRSMALATNGTYTFITDHSGIGNAHIEPSTDEYTVEFLNDVMIRLCVDRSRLQNCADLPIAIVDDTPFNVNDDKDGAQWSFYPNPTSGPLNFRFEAEGGMLYLADTHGKILQRMNTSEHLEINLNAYPAGTYWLKHKDMEGHWTQEQVLLVRR